MSVTMQPSDRRMQRIAVLSTLPVLAASFLALPPSASAVPRHAKEPAVTVTVEAGGETTVNAGDFGLPNYGLSSIELELTSDVSNLASETLTVLPRGAVDDVATPEIPIESGALLAETGTGVGGDVVIVNDGTEPVTITVTANDWTQANRVIPEVEENEFIASAVAMGTPDWMARMAVWDEDLAATTVVSSTLSDTKLTRALAETPISTNGASDGTCGGNYRITGWGHTARYSNWQGQELWRVYFTKRFCFNPSTRVVGSTYFRVNAPVFSGLGNNSWVHVRTSEQANRYISWGGKAKGSHYSHQSHTLKHCAVKWVVCGGDQVYHYSISGYGDGSKIPNWT